MRPNFGTVPLEIKGCQHFMKLAEDHDDRNVVIAYYARMAVIQLAMKILPGPKPPEVGTYLMGIMEWLETTKKEYASIEGMGNETIAQALIEEYMLKLYNYAYSCDCASDFNKNMVKAYYTSSLLCDVLTQFGQLSEDLSEKCDTAKLRAAYIHNCLKKGVEPTPANVTIVGSLEEENEYVVSREEVNRRRALRGEDPLPEPEPPVNDPELDDVPPPSNSIDFEPQEDSLIVPDRIIDIGPPVYPEPRPRKKIESPPEDQPPTPEERPSAAAKTSPTGDLLSSTSVAELQPDQSEKAIKYCKWASSALNYDDVKTAIDNLEKALYLCKFGKEK